MKMSNFKPEPDDLSRLLRKARPAPALPLRFQENVWKRIETADRRGAAATEGNWVEALALWILRPRLALAVAAVLVLAGLGLGWSSGEQLARADSQARYVSAVAPSILR